MKKSNIIITLLNKIDLSSMKWRFLQKLGAVRMKNNQNKFEIKIALSLILLCLVCIGLLKGLRLAFIVTVTICGLGILCLTPFLLAYFIVVWRDEGIKQALKECNPLTIMRAIMREH